MPSKPSSPHPLPAHADALPVSKARREANIQAIIDAPQRPDSASSLALLGIKEGELSADSKHAITALLDKLTAMQSELVETKEKLAQTERLVDVDYITPLPNRRAFMRRLAWSIAMQERYGHPSTVLYFDLNNFKTINDLYGHGVGDSALRHVAILLSEAMRESDYLARIGGDEFAIIMYYASEDAARERARKIVEKIRNTPFVYNGKRHTFSISVGVYTVKLGDTAESALTAADVAMYMDKKRKSSTDIET